MIARKETLVLPQPIFQRLHRHLFPGDGFEAAALLLCTRATGRRRKLLACNLIEVPYEACAQRTENFLSWPGSCVEVAIERAEAAGLSIIAVHSHPGGLFAFSDLDDASDRLLLPALFHGTDEVAGSAIMLPDGAMLGRLYGADGVAKTIDLVSAFGDDLRFWWHQDAHLGTSPKRPVAFTSGMTEWLGRLSACVIGVSGTGSVIAEQLARIGFGEIILVDFDKIEPRNLNRILNATIDDARIGRLKVEMFASAVRHYRAGCDVQCVPSSIATHDAVLAASEADILFSCVDTAEGRHIADRLAAYFAMPLFDLGVSIPTRRGLGDEREIAEVCGRIDYVFPGGSTLLDRGVYDGALLEAEYLARTAPEAFRQKLNDGYLRGIDEQAPAVITLNMRAASDAFMEFIARAFPFRHPPNGSRARTLFMLADGDADVFTECDFVASGRYPIAAGPQEPLLGLPALGKQRRAA
ncbi:ThiF family adenylyltransferase [Bradyrhizobium sp. CCGB01]|uniref:ThiF family adenylyltransferase n=1 Tax=Bradyrhizobium sp. CCGB01 TaxID=2949634 RepID=UPI0020B3B31B|nr:ThiF family adenylyltransferase [Bradyrhizobium sp. CCGB01]MCP3404054.1 ThiF family adenylyltransferase [Bradyrhizobium sp. CCGB01]